jgi:GTP-binding protein
MSQMKSEYLFTVADPSQFEKLFHGPFLKGRREPRIAMVGRSNVGKSTLINSLLGAKLAQTSKQPGKTRAMHFYSWGGAKRIVVDLPGYGYAKASAQERTKWEGFIQLYFEQEVHLSTVLLVMDARHGPTEGDLKAIEFLSLKNIPVTFVFAKADTLKTQSERALRQKEVKQVMQKMGFLGQAPFWISSHDKMGIKELIRYLSKEPSSDQEGEQD